MAVLIKFKADTLISGDIEMFKTLWDKLEVDVEVLPNKYEGWFKP